MRKRNSIVALTLALSTSMLLTDPAFSRPRDRQGPIRNFVDSTPRRNNFDLSGIPQFPSIPNIPRFQANLNLGSNLSNMVGSRRSLTGQKRMASSGLFGNISSAFGDVLSSGLSNVGQIRSGSQAAQTTADAQVKATKVESRRELIGGLADATGNIIASGLGALGSLGLADATGNIIASGLGALGSLGLGAGQALSGAFTENGAGTQLGTAVINEYIAPAIQERQQQQQAEAAAQQLQSSLSSLTPEQQQQLIQSVSATNQPTNP